MPNNTQQHASVVRKTIEHKNNTSGSPLVVVSEIIKASVSRVFEAWSSEKLIKQWWGPEGFTCPYAKIDFRVGEKYWLQMRSIDGKDFWSTGVYSEIEPNKKIVFSDFAADKTGEIISYKTAGIGTSDIITTAFITVEFEALDENITKMTINHEGLPAEMHDDCVQGWSSSFEKMKVLLERH